MELLMEDLGYELTRPPHKKKTKLDLLMDNLGTPDLSSPRIPPPPKTGTSHGEFRDIGSELTQNNVVY